MRRAGDFFPPTARLRSLDALSNASKRSRSRPWPRTGESLGRSGDNCLGERGETTGGGDKRAGLGLSGSCMNMGLEAWKGEKGSEIGSWGGAGEMEIRGTGETAQAAMLNEGRVGKERQKDYRLELEREKGDQHRGDCRE